MDYRVAALTRCLFLVVLAAAGGDVNVAKRACAQDRTGEMRIRMMSYNIHHREGPDGRIDLERIARAIREAHADVVALHQADPQCAELVKLHYFSGFSLEEAGEILGVSRATANRWWIYAKAWLKTALKDRE